jgi:hypothetical protein
VRRGLLVERSQNETTRDFFFRTYADVPTVAKQALRTRLQSLLLPENVRLMLGADSIIDLRDILNHGRPLLVFLGKGSGVPEEQAEMLAGLFLNLFFQAAYRSSRRSRPYTMIPKEPALSIACPRELDGQLDHLLAINSIRIALAMDLPDTGGAIAWWRSDWELRAHGRQRTIPDALFAIDWPDIGERVFASRVIEWFVLSALAFIRAWARCPIAGCRIRRTRRSC